MSDKNLTELEWKKFSKGRDLKDAALVKALASLEKAKAPDAQMTALDEIEKQADLLRKSAKNDKELAGYLDDLDKALDKQRKLSESDAKKAAREAEKKQGDDEEEDSPALLTKMMIPLIRAVKKGDTTLQALVAVAGKETVVLLSRRAISPSRGKLLKEQMASPGGLKFIRGECLLEQGALTFVVQSQAAGLAKKLRAALLAQTDLRLKVRVRGEDPDDLDSDGEDEGDGDGDGEAPGSLAQGGAQAAAASPATTAAGTSGTDSLAQQYQVRMAAIEPQVLAALKAQQGDVSKLRAVAEFTREKGASGQYQAALKGLENLQKLLEAARGPSPTATPPAMAEALSEWRAQRDAIVGSLKALAQEVVESGDVDARAAVIEISAVVKQLTAEPSTQQQVSELMTWLQNDDVVSDVNEFAQEIREPLLERLRALQSSMVA